MTKQVKELTDGGYSAFEYKCDVSNPQEVEEMINNQHAIIGLTRTASIDYTAKGIRINAVLPGVILTPMAKDIIKRNLAMEEAMVRDIPKGRLGEPYEIAHAVMWLCSPYATFVDGAAISVDGGFTIH